MRKLATIRNVDNIVPIPGADAIETAVIGGWSVVVKKGEFRIGQQGVYFEIDSWLPASNPAFEFLRPKFKVWNNIEGFRLKTIKLRGQISQGLLLPLSSFPELQSETTQYKNDTDVTDILKIEKWERIEEHSSNAGGPGIPGKKIRTRAFPSFIPKTDEERVQNCSAALNAFTRDDRTFEVTVKLDGSSTTVYFVPKTSKYFDQALREQLGNMPWYKRAWIKVAQFLGLRSAHQYVYGVCSRNVNLDTTDDSNQFVAIANQMGIEQKLAKLGRAIAIQGELVGPSIQNNYEKRTVNEFYVFRMFDIDSQDMIVPAERRELAKTLELNHTPVLETDWKIPTEDAMSKILTMASGPGLDGKKMREGLVYKCNEQRFSFKAISNEYLLKQQD